MYEIYTYTIRPNELEEIKKVATVEAEDVAIAIVNYIQEMAADKSNSIPKIRIYDGDEILRTYPSKSLLKDADFCTRTYACLKRHGIKYIEDLYTMSINEIIGIRNLSNKCAQEVLNYIANNL